MSNNKNIGTDDQNQTQGHHCLKCGEALGGGVFMKYLANPSVSDIQCTACFKAHEFDDENAKLIPLLIFILVFLLVAAGLIYLVLYQWRTQGMLFYIQLVLPLIIGYIAGSITSKMYKWKTGKLVLFGH